MIPTEKIYSSDNTTYDQKSVSARLEALFLNNVGLVVTREQIIAAARNPITGKEPENWHQRLSELRTDKGYTILSARDWKALKPEEYVLASVERREKAAKRVPSHTSHVEEGDRERRPRLRMAGRRATMRSQGRGNRSDRRWNGQIDARSHDSTLGRSQLRSNRPHALASVVRQASSHEEELLGWRDWEGQCHRYLTSRQSRAKAASPFIP